MIVCPFCQYENEDGALFCEQCKSDLAGVESTGGAIFEAEPVEAEPVEAEPVGGDIFTADVVEAAPVEAEAVEAEPVEAEPAEAEPVEAAPPPAAPPPVPAAAKPAAPAAPAAAPAGAGIPAGATVVLRVIRGQKVNFEFPIYEGQNFIGRADDQPVDIDLEDQEPPDRIWCSRQHALILYENGGLTLEDLNSSNGTFLNRERVYPGTKAPLKENDVIQIGTVQLRLQVK